MEKILKQTDLKKFYQAEKKLFRNENVEEFIKEKRDEQTNRINRKSIFLCHSHKDKNTVENVALLFNKLDSEIYVDWMDNTMPKVTDHTTAGLIRQKIQHCHRFLFLATYYGMRSKWCDWELGLAYSLKKETEFAILPIGSRSGNWRGSEYLGLYPVMVTGDTDLNTVVIDEVFIQMPGGEKKIPLEEWLVSDEK